MPVNTTIVKRKRATTTTTRKRHRKPAYNEHSSLELKHRRIKLYYNGVLQNNTHVFFGINKLSNMKSIFINKTSSKYSVWKNNEIPRLKWNDAELSLVIRKYKVVFLSKKQYGVARELLA